MEWGKANAMKWSLAQWGKLAGAGSVLSPHPITITDVVNDNQNLSKAFTSVASCPHRRTPTNARTDHG